MYKNRVIKKVLKSFCLLLISSFVYAGQGQSSMSGTESGVKCDQIKGQVLNVTNKTRPKGDKGRVGIGNVYDVRVEVVGNQVLVFNTKVREDCSVCGGYNLGRGDVSGNAVEMNKGLVEDGSVFGGYSQNDFNTIGNKVKICSSTIGRYVYGGDAGIVRTLKSEASSNVVEIDNSNIGWGISGGYAGKRSIGNRVTLNNVNIGREKEGDVYGGKVFGHRYLTEFQVSSNVVSIYGGSIKGNVFGGSEDALTLGSGGDGKRTIMNDNRVEASTVNIMGNLYGAAAYGGTVTRNSVEIHNSDIGKNIYGGYVTSTGTACSNSVLVSSVNVVGRIYGAKVDKGELSGNCVWIKESDIYVSIYGAYANNGIVHSNKMRIINARIGEDIYGGRVETEGIVDNNKVIIDSASVRCVYGGYVAGGESSRNTAIVGNSILRDIYGGYVNSTGTAHSNSVLVSSVNVSGSVHGAYAKDGRVYSNELKMISARVGQNVYGGRVETEGKVENNRVIIDSVSVSGSVYGGYVTKGESSRNTAIVGNSILRDIYGGYVNSSGAAHNNSVLVSSVNVSESVHGAYAKDGRVYSNELKMISARVGQNVYGGRVERVGKVENNRVIIDSVSVSGSVYGGYVTAGEPSSNTVEINGGSISGDVYGGYTRQGKNKYEVVVGTKTIWVEEPDSRDVYYNLFCCDEVGMRASENKRTVGTVRVQKMVPETKTVCTGVEVVEVNGNKIEVVGGEVRGNIYGGYIVSKGIVSTNTVTVNDGRVTKNIYGGYVGEGSVVCNEVKIIGTPIFSSNTVIYGGYSPSVAAEVCRGNILSLETEEPVVLKGVKNFEYYNFGSVVPNAPALPGVGGEERERHRFGRIVANAPVVLRVEEGVDLTRSKVRVKVEGEAKEGDRLNLIESQGVVSQAERINILRDALIEYEYNRLLEDPHLLTLIIRGQIATAQAQAINEVASAGIVVVGQAIGFLADKGIEEAVGAVRGKEGIEVFGVVEGNNSKYKNTAEVKMEGMKVVGGVAKSLKEGNIVVGGYIGHGKGDYRAREVEGVGNTNYTGLGGLVRKEVGEKWYIDGSVNVGGYGIEYKNEITEPYVEDIGYDYKAMYVGGHVGCAYKCEVSEKLDIDMVGKVLLMRQEGKEEKLANGMPVNFEGVMSGKIKGLAKARYKCNEKVIPYVGVGYEYELLGKSKAKIDGVELKEIDLKGGSGLGEIGISSILGDLNINISGRGYIGIREGVEGMLKIGYAI
jgi:hypothetical protein